MATIERVHVIGVGPDIPRTTWASMPPQFMLMTIVQVFDSDGGVGVGCTQSYGSGEYDFATFESIRTLGQYIIGKDPSNIEARWRDLHTYITPTAPGAIAAVDIALWDLAAKKARLPLYKMLGGSRDSIPAYASTAELETTADYLDHVEEMIADGFTAIKFHAWNVPEKDLEMLTTVHKKFGDTVTFMHDAENRYDFNGAVKVGRALEEMGFRWFEAPFRDYDLASYFRLRERIKIPIVPHGLWLMDLQEIYHHVSRFPWDAVRFDASMSGGITQARKMVAIAEALGLPAEQQSWGYSLIQGAAIHVGLASPVSSYFELPIPYDAYEYGIVNPIRCDENGEVRAPDGHGIGLEIDWDAMKRATLAEYDCKSVDDL
ncbi:mandelate racemase [Acrocarpospora pleiomorpha]|uniref:Mandelate racemase n=1 Tax=Acrocarpospora pleiomorpha TaxID=90975 RepID=A0A5M3XP67_9ACTN|nr:mandelate racemase/muconate lactonizing enzyme family protein [Acrocarpospora pleiomorpha]GES20038.1 mandelate racemase [Acrocarpospora pleiomorpha]